MPIPLKLYTTTLLSIIRPALAAMPQAFRSPEAEVMLLAIAAQESALTYRHQIGGPAHGLWQFESGGGVRGVLNHRTTATHARTICDAHGVEPTQAAAFDAIEVDDAFACKFARLLLWSDPWTLPPFVGMQQPADRTVDAAWALYTRVWRPGKPHPEAWPQHFYDAHGCVAANPNEETHP